MCERVRASALRCSSVQLAGMKLCPHTGAEYWELRVDHRQHLHIGHAANMQVQGTPHCELQLPSTPTSDASDPSSLPPLTLSLRKHSVRQRPRHPPPGPTLTAAICASIPLPSPTPSPPSPTPPSPTSSTSAFFGSPYPSPTGCVWARTTFCIDGGRREWRDAMKAQRRGPQPIQGRVRIRFSLAPLGSDTAPQSSPSKCKVDTVSLTVPIGWRTSREDKERSRRSLDASAHLHDLVLPFSLPLMAAQSQPQPAVHPVALMAWAVSQPACIGSACEQEAAPSFYPPTAPVAPVSPLPDSLIEADETSLSFPPCPSPSTPTSTSSTSPSLSLSPHSAHSQSSSPCSSSSSFTDSFLSDDYQGEGHGEAGEQHEQEVVQPRQPLCSTLGPLPSLDGWTQQPSLLALLTALQGLDVSALLLDSGTRPAMVPLPAVLELLLSVTPVLFSQPSLLLEVASYLSLAKTRLPLWTEDGSPIPFCPPVLLPSPSPALMAALSPALVEVMVINSHRHPVLVSMSGTCMFEDTQPCCAEPTQSLTFTRLGLDRLQLSWRCMAGCVAAEGGGRAELSPLSGGHRQQQHFIDQALRIRHLPSPSFLTHDGSQL